ncbi:glycosyltransferase family 4 protein [Natronincola ferrireducens]|uniref:Glycosyltransferase involved in cell wall bisynthesis n=1 Tax=Natronincola ferrireducens TaxID=393762 RepID=A0A1G8X5J6_9FIRM|nr:glycosyltransferase family 4 protein [Natronincola ferrireducens]SDJ85899.1 Glycosyltransferase involved in cell wall bisynthesis [Natronincola ferrireducens]
MKALFAHGLKFFEDSNGNLYLRGYDTNYWNRYLKHFDELYVIGRKQSISDEHIAGFNKFDGDGLFFVEVPDIHNYKTYFRSNKLYESIAKKIVNDVDVIIARIPGTYSSKIIKYAKQKDKPYLVEMVGCPWDSLWNHSLKGKFVAPFMMQSTKKILGKAPYVIYVTNKFLQNRYPTKGKQTNCSNVTLPKMDDAVLTKRIEKIKSNSSSEIVIGTTAAVDVRYKGQQYVVEALGKLKAEGNTNYRYQLVGGGDTSYLESIIKKYNVGEQVEFLGAKSHNKVFEWLDTIDIYIQPSRQEGLPRALIEAMSRGLPSLGAATGGIPELLDEKYIFSNTNKNISEIVTILTNLSKEDMEMQATRNYEEAKKYGETLIDNRRSEFIESFLKSIKREDRI